jgi:ATP-dependent Clp protease protease subunit
MMERDYFMTAEEAKNFGLIDKVLEKRTEPKGTDDPTSSTTTKK